MFVLGTARRQRNRVLYAGVWLITAGCCIPWCWPAAAQDPTQRGSDVEITLEVLEPIHRQAAAEYEIYTDRFHNQRLVLRETPVSQWMNPRRAGGQLGHVFVWMQGERPAAMAAIFSFPWGGVATDRRIVHELHALAPSRLYVTRSGRAARWEPKSGLSRKPLPGVKGDPTSLAAFRIRSRHVARRFSGHCVDTEGQRWELRMLPKPLLVYPIEPPNGQGFGAIVGMMGDVGSDLESGLIIEAVQPIEQGGRATDTRWSFAPIRMTDMETHLLFDDQPIWDSVRTETDTSFFDTPHVYFRFQDKTVPLETGP
jgi:hypothetical protein